MPSQRVQETLERLQEHETLSADLTDPAATALLEWMTRQVVAADAAASPEQFAAQVDAIQRAARQAVRMGTRAPTDASADAVVARAQEVLRQIGDPALIAPVPLPTAAPLPETAVPSAPAPATTRAAPAPDTPAGVSSDPTALLRRAPRPPSPATEEPPQRPRRVSFWSRLRRRWRL